ncbi:MAG: hypothetical protein K6C08_12880 [Oscillospiraceae bacterium]|nr:hypothetical protein [Oscillospiraceae bacterium]
MVAIDPDKPLPDHTRLDYDECCAKLILEELLPERYAQLELADKPDLQGQDVGIEVTVANDPKMQEALNNWIKANSDTNEEMKALHVARMAQLGVIYTGGVQSLPGGSPTFQWVKTAVERKIEKLKNGHYSHFPRYELFVITGTWFWDGIVQQAEEFFFSGAVKSWYKTIYVLSEGADLHIFETDLQKHVNIQINNAQQTDRNIRARRMVEAGEQE